LIDWLVGRSVGRSIDRSIDCHPSLPTFSQLTAPDSTILTGSVCLVIEPFLSQAQQSGTLLASHCNWALSSCSFRQLLKGYLSPVLSTLCAVEILMILHYIDCAVPKGSKRHFFTIFYFSWIMTQHNSQ